MEDYKIVKNYGMEKYFDSFGYSLLEMDVDDYINNMYKVELIVNEMEGYGVYLHDIEGNILDIEKLHEYVATGEYDKRDLTVLVYNPEIC